MLLSRNLQNIFIKDLQRLKKHTIIQGITFQMVKIGSKVINYLRSNSNKESYQEGLKQVTCHLIGISNVMRDRTAIEWFNKNSWLSHLYHINISDVKKIIFKSLVFHPNTEIEGTLSEDYEILNREFVSKQINFVPKELILENPIITYKELWNNGMRDSITDPELKEYLEKYLSAHD